MAINLQSLFFSQFPRYCYISLKGKMYLKVSDKHSLTTVLFYYCTAYKLLSLVSPWELNYMTQPHENWKWIARIVEYCILCNIWVLNCIEHCTNSVKHLIHFILNTICISLVQQHLLLLCDDHCKIMNLMYSKELLSTYSTTVVCYTSLFPYHVFMSLYSNKSTMDLQWWWQTTRVTHVGT